MPRRRPTVAPPRSAAGPNRNCELKYAPGGAPIQNQLSFLGPRQLFWNAFGIMTDAELAFSPETLLVFIDETGNEDYGDPKNPTFGRGGCAVLGEDYKRLIKKPWRRMKREKMGGAGNLFHATEFEKSKPTKRQIAAISRFLQQPFWRFAVMSDVGTELPSGIDGHRAISLVTVNFVRKLVAIYKDVAAVALVFEASGRGDKLVKRDFDLANMKLFNGSGKPVAVKGCFMEKKYM